MGFNRSIPFSPSRRSCQGGVNLWSDEDVDQASIDFRRYRCDQATTVCSTHFYNNTIAVHHSTPHPHETSPLFQHFSPDRPPPRSKEQLLHRRRWRGSVLDDHSGSDQSSSRSSSSSLSRHRGGVSEMASHHYYHSRHHPHIIETPPVSKRRPPLPHPPPKQGCSNRNFVVDGASQFDALNFSNIAAEESNCGSHWKPRQGRQGTRARQRYVITRSVEPQHSRNVVHLYENKTTPRAPTDYPPLYCNKKPGMTSPRLFGRKQPPSHRQVPQSQTTLSSPFRTPSKSSHDSQHHRNTYGNAADQLSIGSMNHHHTKENSRSVADFRSPRHQSSNNELVIPGTTAQKTLSRAAMIGETDDKSSLFSDYRFSSIDPSGSFKASPPTPVDTHGVPFSTTTSMGKKNPTIGGMFRRWQKQSMRDELIEVVAVRSLFHLGQIQVTLKKSRNSHTP